MELYNEYKNKYFRAINEVIDAILSSPTSYPESNYYSDLGLSGKKYISEYAFYGIIEDYLKIPENNEMLYNFNKYICQDILYQSKIFIVNYNEEIHVNKNERKVSLSIEKSLPIIPCLVEQQWLKNAVQSPVSDIFFDTESKQDFIQALDNIDIPFVDTDKFTNIKTTYRGDKINKKFVSHMRTILTAIHDNRTIVYSSNPNTGEPHYNEKTVPYLIEYSIFDKKFRLIHYPFKDKRPVKSNISNFTQVELGDEYHGKGTIKELVEGKKATPLEFILFYRPDKPFISEKALLLFSKYERNISEDSDGNLIFTIEYYQFQERELLSEILSFGPYLEVRAPQAFRDKIIERLKMA